MSLSADGSFTYTPQANFNGTDTFTYKANDGTADSNAATVTITITECKYSLSPSSARVGSAAGAVTVSVDTSGDQCPWTATTAAPWITLDSDGNGTGPGSFRAQVQANPAGRERSGNVTVAGRDFEVTQAAASCGYELAVETVTVLAAESEGQIVVETLSGCEWVATSATEWLVTEIGSGTGPGAVPYTVAANTSADRRRGRIDVVGRGDRKRTHVVLQHGVAATDRPLAPSNLKLVARVNGNPKSKAKVTFEWTNNADDALGFMVKRTGGGSPELFVLASSRGRLRDNGVPFATRYCYEVRAFNDAGRSGPLRGCVWTPTASGERAVRLESEGSPDYVTEAAVVVVERDAVQANVLPIVRVYEAYEPWGEPEVELSLDHLGYVRGESLFVHPITDLAHGIPVDTAMVILPSASEGDQHRQLSTVNDKAVQHELRRFATTGGTVVLHRWTPDNAAYRVPVGGKPVGERDGYQRYRAGKGMVLATELAADHPGGGPLQANLYRLLERLLIVRPDGR